MLAEITITIEEAVEAIAAIKNHLSNGSVGFDPEKLKTVLKALQEADRIVIGG